MAIRKFALPGIIILAVGIGSGLWWLSKITQPDPGALTPPSPLSLTGPRSLNLSNGAIVSCDANGPGQAVSFISQSTENGDKKTVIISEYNGHKTVAAIAVNADRLLYVHFPDPIEHASPTLAKGTYDAGRQIYKPKYLGPGDAAPTIKDWQANLALAKAICGGRAPDAVNVTLRSQKVGAYEADKLDKIDKKLNGLLLVKNPIDRSEVEKYLGLGRYSISAFLPT